MNPEKNSKEHKKPWPTKAAMEQVYTMKLWGGNTAHYYSGDGSHLPELVNPYIEAVTTFLKSFENPLTVVDLGCGDFNIGNSLVQHTKKYIAVDIVPDLIKHNIEKFKTANLEFYCLDLAKDALPQGDCAILRQVLQHISNTEVLEIIKKLHAYKYVIVTEHIPKEPFIPNKDIISGQGIRLKKQSGIHLLEPPFNWIVKNERQLLSIPLAHGKGLIVTTLYEVF
ncbi:class I SAM-dependent methyltransferase [Bizionia sp. M204]|uniref:class I SAM-dependent methyltransferase n=1 Tax=unclassified Bizionia TaxID=2626393 RepID=UPI00206732CD|nr:class I SAM-dependent methyltransferase [Bizionia sp. M204]UPS93050.1 methyltransferase domain-containing protein [Bizionia sp. M204]